MNGDAPSGLAAKIATGPSLYEHEYAFQTPLGGLKKRCFDVAFAFITIAILSPLFVLVAVAVKLCDGGRIFYRHPRIGTRGETFDCLKFRTMREDSGAALTAYLAENPSARQEWLETRKLKHDPRITAVGTFLRTTSLDELPQLINILIGHMSIVGPRPIVADEVQKYGREAHLYFVTRPGLTGAWQISGRSDTTYDERVRLDSEYVRNWTFANDIIIVLRTVPAVFLSRGSY